MKIDISQEELEETKQLLDLPVDENTPSGRLFIYSTVTGINGGLNRIEALSFGRIITELLSPLSISMDTDKYIREDKIIRKVEQEQLDDDEDIFNYVLNIYINNLNEYYKKTELITIRSTLRIKEYISEIDGDSQVDKIEKAIIFYHNNH